MKAAGLFLILATVAALAYHLSTRDPGKLYPISSGDKIRKVAEFLIQSRGEPELKKEYFKKIYTTDLRCWQKEIFLFSDLDLEVPAEITRGFAIIGSAGPLVTIVLSDKSGNMEVAWEGNLIDIRRFEPNGNCPDLLVELHGSHFGRAGKLYGEGRLVFVGNGYETWP